MYIQSHIIEIYSNFAVIVSFGVIMMTSTKWLGFIFVERTPVELDEKVAVPIHVSKNK